MAPTAKPRARASASRNWPRNRNRTRSRKPREPHRHLDRARIGTALAQQLASALDATVYQPWQQPDDNARQQFAAVFHQHRQWVLLMASGIAVRYLDGLPHSKLTDPAVVVLDEAARFAIPLLSGHEGGANALAYHIARLTGATPAITTATEALKPLTLGIGCRRGKSADAIEQAVLQALAGRSLSEVREVATIDLKADEIGLLEFCARHDLPLRVIPAPTSPPVAGPASLRLGTAECGRGRGMRALRADCQPARAAVGTKDGREG
jgi:cobalt-precorrin 5A hydrolase